MPDPFDVRVQAARELVDAGVLDGLLALSYVIFPSAEVEAASDVVVAKGDRRRRGCSDEQRLRALELVDAGMSWAAAGCEVGVAKTTVQTWIKRRSVAGNGDGSETSPGPHQQRI